jgi:thiamine-phosphate pyrophosphorylase
LQKSASNAGLQVKACVTMLTCYITGPRGFARVAEAFAAGVDFVQLRAKELDARELLRLCQEAARLKGPGKLLVNDRLDVALAGGADGLHLPSNRPPGSAYRSVVPPGFVFSAACHTVDEVKRAKDEGATIAILAPIFATPGKGPPIGVSALEQASRVGIPVLALGGITLDNAAQCRDAGAAGIAAIRLFEEVSDMAAVVRELRTDRRH